MTDIVYLLGAGSKWKNNESRYSLRSVEKHLSDVGKVYFIGHQPDFLKDVVHVSAPDKPVENINKARNIAHKVKVACEIPEISDPFLLFSDDYFINKDFSADSFHYYVRGEDLYKGAERCNPHDPYRRVYFNTINALTEQGLGHKHFNLHAPMPIRKDEMIRAIDSADCEIQFGVMIKSLYGNFIKAEGVVMDDCKIGARLSLDEYKKILSEKSFFSISDMALFAGANKFHQPLLDLFESLYPNKSRWEN